MAHRAGDETTKKSGLFDDLSLAQVVAGALAAVTSMLLASQIGIYGSVIGVGVGSVVSAVASQLYKKFLQRSADKLRDLSPGETILMAKPSARDRRGADDAGGADGASANEGAETAVLPADGRRVLERTPAPVVPGQTPHLDDAAQEGDVTARRAIAQRDHKKRVKRGVLAVSIVSALAAVAVSAFVIYALSAGQGVGAKTEPLLPSPRAQSSSDDGDGASSANQEGSSDSPKAQDNASSDSSKDANKDSSGGQSGSSAEGSGSNSGSGSSSGDAGSSSGSGSGSGSNSGGSSTGSDGSSGSGSGSGSGAGGASGTGDNLSDSGGSAGSGSGGGSGTGSGSSSTSGAGSIPKSSGSSGASSSAASSASGSSRPATVSASALATV